MTLTHSTPPDLLARLQRRVARLLLRHDRHIFRGRFRELYARSALPQPPELQAYDHLTRLILLADELLDDIMPRIRRQMSFQATRTRQEEEPPVRGQIDWDSSLRRTWNERPDHPPTHFVTRLHSRTFSTPENGLVIAVLESYAHELVQARTGQLFTDAPLTPVEQRELAQIEERVRREQATIACQEHACDAGDLDPAALIAAVEQRLRPGINPYRDLVDWWQRFERLHLHSGTADQRATPVLASRDASDLLYHLWIALELVEFLAARHLLTDVDSQTNQLAVCFAWPPDSDHGRSFRFLYHRQPPASHTWNGAPLLCASSAIARADAMVIEHDGKQIWREPDVIIGAACCLNDDDQQAAEPLKRLLAEMQLLDAPGGILILPNTAHTNTHVYPRQDRFLGVTSPETEVRLYQLQPLEQLDQVHEQLEALLNQATAWLPERPAVVCHGFLQDSDTINPGSTQPQRCRRCGDVLAVCFKPHVSPNYTNLVCPRCDCLHSVHLCHIMGTTAAGTNKPLPAFIPPFIKRITSQDKLLTMIQAQRQRLQTAVAPDDESEPADEARTLLFQTIGDLTDAFVAYTHPDTGQIEYLFREGFFPKIWSDEYHPRGLPEDVRNMLISGDYVRSRFQQSSVKDWAACAVQYVRSLEREMRRRLYETCKIHLLNKHAQPLPYFTFGMPGAAYRKRNSGDYNQHNWQAFLSYIVASSSANAAAFEQLIQDIDALRSYRNEIAHTGVVGQPLAEHVRTVVVGELGQPGLLRRLIEMLNPPL